MWTPKKKKIEGHSSKCQSHTKKGHLKKKKEKNVLVVKLAFNKNLALSISAAKGHLAKIM